MRIYRKQGGQIPSILLLVFLVWGCNYRQEFKGTPGDLNYTALTEKSETLSADLALSANIKKQEMLAELKLTNTGAQPIVITGIAIYAEGGLQSFPSAGNIKPVTLPAGRDTLITAKFKPVNDIKVYQLTGKQGHFKPQYKVSVFYKQQGTGTTSSIALITQLPDDNYKAYLSKYAAPFVGYSFNTASTFDQAERDYLEKLKLKDPAFTFVAQHELALTGLNIWMTSYCENDTLYAELLMVNHDDYAVKIIPDSLDFVYKVDNTPGDTKTVVLDKIAGSRENKTLLEKGGKLLIHFKKPFKSSNKRVVISLKHAFILDGAQNLFTDNIELLKVRLP